jgi:hypothetical protein
VGELLRDPRDPSVALPAMPLLLVRGFRSEPAPGGAAAAERRRAAASRAAQRPVNVLDRAGIGVARGAPREDAALPGPETALAPGDRLLLAGVEWAEGIQRRFLLDPSPIQFVRTGVEPARSWAFRRLAASRAARTGRTGAA